MVRIFLAFVILCLPINFNYAFAQSSIFENIVEDVAREVIRQGIQSGQSQGGQTTEQAAPNPAPQPAQVSRGNVAEIQSMLTELGYRPGPIDGLMGSRTADAIRTFQSDMGLARTGEPSVAVERQLQAAVAESDVLTSPQFTAEADPSFDCARAATSTELAICGSERLADLDRALADAYRDRANATGNSAALRQEQRAWLQERNACGGSEGCLEQSMRRRIAALGGAEASAEEGESGDAPMAIVNVGLEGSDAYAALLERYMREHPAAAQHPDFLPYFAGLGCRAQGWGRSQNLNPFELAEIESGARTRLARRLAEASTAPEPALPLITFRANVTAGDYAMDEGTFPIVTGGSIESNLRPDDFCQSVARAKGVRQQSAFPTRFEIAAVDGSPLDASDVAQMLGGEVSIERETARAFYERGYPTIVVEITGRVRELARAGDGKGRVTLDPMRATLRTQGNAQYSRELAVLGPERLGPLGSAPNDVADPGADMRFPELSEAALIAALLRDDPEYLAKPSIAAQYAYWDGDRGCIPEAELRGKANAEFARQDLLDAAPARARARLEAVPDIRRFSIVDQATLREYDGNAGAFTLNLQYSNGRPDDDPQRFRYALLDRLSPPDCLNADGPGLPEIQSLQIRDSGLLAQLPMAPDAAEALVLGNPERALTVRMDVELEGFAREYGQVRAARLMVLRAEIIDKATGDVLRTVTLEDVEDARPEADRWAEIPEVSFRQMLVRLVRQHPELAEQPAYLRAFMGAVACNRLLEADGNPITMQRLVREYGIALQEEITASGPGHVRLVYGDDGYGRVELGDYSLETERFGFDLDGGQPFAEETFAVRAHCRGQSLSESPNEIHLELSGLRDLAASGVPMPLARAEQFFERYGGRKDGRERRVTLVVIAKPGRMAPAPGSDGAGAPSGKLEAVAMRVVDPFDGSTLHSAGALPETDDLQSTANNGADTPEAPARAAAAEAIPMDQETRAAPGDEAALELLGVRLGMSRQEAQSALAERFPPDAIAALQDNILAAEEGPCLYHTVTEPGLADEAGSACALVRFGADGSSASVMVRNVVPGAQSEAVQDMLASRFGAAEGQAVSGETLILGWGSPLETTDGLDRDLTAGQTPRTLEARISEAQGVTLVTLRLDAEPTPPEPAQVAPEIKF